MNTAVALVFTAVLSAAPATPAEPEPVRVSQGSAFVCRMEGGCYVANEQGMEQTVREVSEHVQAKCGKSL